MREFQTLNIISQEILKLELSNSMDIQCSHHNQLSQAKILLELVYLIMLPLPNYGNTIEISYDKTDPRHYNIPTILRSVRYMKYKKRECVFAAICGTCCLIIYIVNIFIYHLWTGFYYLMYAVLLLLCFYCMFRCGRHYNSGVNRAKEDYGTFSDRIQNSENIYQNIRDMQQSDYIKMEMINPLY